MELLSQVVRVVTINGRAPELHVERVQRRFAEVWCGREKVPHEFHTFPKVWNMTWVVAWGMVDMARGLAGLSVHISVDIFPLEQRGLAKLMTHSSTPFRRPTWPWRPSRRAQAQSPPQQPSTSPALSSRDWPTRPTGVGPGLRRYCMRGTCDDRCDVLQPALSVIIDPSALDPTAQASTRPSGRRGRAPSLRLTSPARGGSGGGPPALCCNGSAREGWT